MDLQDIRETSAWGLYVKGQNYHRLTGIYTDTDKNYRFYNGDQWSGAKLGDVEPVQKNFIKSIVKYKVGVVHDNLYSINYSSQNHESEQFQREAEKYTDMLNRFAHRVWEKEKMDKKLRQITKDSAINDEGILYIDFDEETQMPIVEVVNKNDIYYGNENDADIQNQPYILIRKRMPVSNARDFAIARGVSEFDARMILGDNQTFELSGDASKEEVDDMVTIIYKLYKDKGTIHFDISTRYVDIVEKADMGIKLYPVVHFNWEEKKGSARGEGEVRYLIPNQIEVNKTEVRRVITVKTQAFPQKVVDKSRITNASQLNIAGAVIETNGQPVDDVNKVVGTIKPAQMSPDVKQLQEDLIQMTRDLAGAGDVATGNVNPEDASGRAILAVQQAQRSPMTEQKEECKDVVENIALIWLEYLIVHSTDGIKMEQEIDMGNGQKQFTIVTVPQSVLEQLQATVKVDVTPKSVYDKFAQEQTIENLLLQGFLTAQRIGELEIYADLLDDDSVAPKMKIKEACEMVRKEQQKIAMMQTQMQAMRMRANQFINGDIQSQAQQMADAMSQGEMPAEEMPQEEMAEPM